LSGVSNPFSLRFGPMLLGLIFDSSIDETGLTELLSKIRLSDPYAIHELNVTSFISPLG
jgi:hypothetical protein